MSQNYHDIIEQLKAQAEARRPLADQFASNWWHDSASYVMPTASSEQIAATEVELGLKLPPLLKTIYREVGNGGQLLGPGLFGLPGGYDSKNDEDIVACSQSMASILEWWDQYIVVCDRGCSMCSCVDCADDDFAVYRWDGNGFNDPAQAIEPTDDIWEIEANTFEEWIVQELHALNARLTPSVTPGEDLVDHAKRPRWWFW